MNTHFLKLCSAIALLLSTQALTRAGSTDEPAVDAEETPVVFNGRSFPMFPIKIQPVLMNLCARCHCHAQHTSHFKLSRVREGYADPQSAGRNARAVVRFLSPENPGASEFLQKAVTAHGGAKDPPLNSRNHPAFKNLEYWAYWAMSPEGSPVAVVPRPQPQPSPQPQTTIVTASATRKAEPAPADATEPQPTMPAEPTSGGSAEPRRLPPVSTSPPSLPPASPVSSRAEDAAPKRNPDDPFDPAEFNSLGR